MKRPAAFRRSLAAAVMGLMVGLAHAQTLPSEIKARPDLPSLDTLLGRAEAHAKAVGAVNCRVRIKDTVGSATGSLKALGRKFLLDVERRDVRGRILGRERAICNGKVIWVLAIPRGRTVPSVRKLDIARMEALAAERGDIRGERPDLCANPVTALLDLREGFDLAVMGEQKVQGRHLIQVEAKRKPLSLRRPTWTGCNHVLLLLDPATAFAVYTVKLNDKGERVREVVADNPITRLKITEQVFEYTPPKQAPVEDVAERLEKMSRQPAPPTPGAAPPPAPKPGG